MMLVAGRRSTATQGIRPVAVAFRNRGRTAALLLACTTVVAAGCSFVRPTPRIAEPVGLMAVMPIERATLTSATPADGRPPLPPRAASVVTAQIYSVLSTSPKWRFVPDLTVAGAMRHIGQSGDLSARARALGKAVGADGVLFGTVFRYVERKGDKYGVQHPASVGFTLQLISVASGKILWTGTFDQEQQALSANLFNWWQFWHGGPKWFRAWEFARLGVERLLNDLSEKLGR
ncbi:MAG: hypothetical protein ACE5I7_15385 [Candidatus Binatia bacterium]